jgi:hypothetical protein
MAVIYKKRKKKLKIRNKQNFAKDTTGQLPSDWLMLNVVF